MITKTSSWLSSCCRAFPSYNRKLSALAAVQLGTLSGCLTWPQVWTFNQLSMASLQPPLHLKPHSDAKPYPLTHTDLCLSLSLRLHSYTRCSHSILYILYPYTTKHGHALKQLTQLKACRAYRGRKHARHAESYLTDAFSNVKCMRVHVKAGERVALQELRQRYETELRLKCIRAKRFRENISPQRERQVY